MNGPMLSFTTMYTPPRTNMLQLSMYTERTAKLNSITRQHEPGRRRANRGLGNAAGVKGRGGQVGKDDGGASPEADEGQRYGGRHHDFGGGRGGLANF